jgi:hypothetical protein
MNCVNENDFFHHESFPIEIDGWCIEKAHFILIYDLARDQCRDPYEYLESLLKWMREQGYGPGDQTKYRLFV